MRHMAAHITPNRIPAVVLDSSSGNFSGRCGTAILHLPIGEPGGCSRSKERAAGGQAFVDH